MSEREQDGSAPAGRSRGGDESEALQNELRREASEGRDGIGDVNDNRNLSGSSTWETIVDSPSRAEMGDRGEVL